MRSYILLPLLGLLNMGADAATIHNFNARNRALDHRYNPHSHTTTRRQVHNADFSGSSSSANSVVSAPPPSAETSPDSSTSGSPSTSALASAAAVNRRAMLADADPVADVVDTVSDANGDLVDGQAETESADMDVKKRQFGPVVLGVTGPSDGQAFGQIVSGASEAIPANIPGTLGFNTLRQTSPVLPAVTADAPSSGSISTSDSTLGINGSKASKGKRNLLSKGLDLHSSAAAKNPSTMLPRTSVGVPLPFPPPARVGVNTNDGSSALVSRQTDGAEIDAASDDTDDAPDATDSAINADVVADASKVESDSADTTGSLLPRDFLSLPDQILQGLPVSSVSPPIRRDIVVNGVSPMDVSASDLSSFWQKVGGITLRDGATLKGRDGITSAIAVPGVSGASAAAKVRRQSSEGAAISATGVSSILSVPNGSVATRDIKIDTPFDKSFPKISVNPTAMQTQVQRKRRNSSTLKSTTNLKGSVPRNQRQR